MRSYSSSQHQQNQPRVIAITATRAKVNTTVLAAMAFTGGLAVVYLLQILF